MRILSIDTSATVATVAVSDGGRLVSEYSVNNKKTHSQTLMPMIDRVLKDCETEIKDIDLIAVANGPGSFTGLRIGVSCAKGIAHALKIPLVGISTLTALAYNLPYCEYLISPIMDARRSQVYNAVYEWENGELKDIKAPRALSLEELLEEFKGCDKKIVFLGDGVPVHRETIKDTLLDKALFAPMSASIQKASTLLDIAESEYKKGNTKSCYELVPFYLRKSQAEREADEREQNLRNEEKKQ